MRVAKDRRGKRELLVRPAKRGMRARRERLVLKGRKAIQVPQDLPVLPEPLLRQAKARFG